MNGLRAINTDAHIKIIIMKKLGKCRRNGRTVGLQTVNDFILFAVFLLKFCQPLVSIHHIRVGGIIKECNISQ